MFIVYLDLLILLSLKNWKIIDRWSSGHIIRIFSFFGEFKFSLIGSLKFLALLVIVAVIIFLDSERTLFKLKEFLEPEMSGFWPKKDGI